MITFEQFLKKVDDTFLSHQAGRSNGKIKAENQWRYGQTLMNVLFDIWSDKYYQIMNTEYNCFYSNHNIHLTIDKLRKEWANENYQ